MIERTTVRLPEDLLDRARRKALAEGRTLTSLIEDGLWMVVADKPKATKRIERFLKRVREEGCRGFRCSEEKGLSSEAFALLFFNGQFLLDHLPPSRDRDDDRDRSDD